MTTEKEKEYQHLYYEKRKDNLRKYKKEYYKNNRERELERGIKYKENNLEKVRTAHRLYSKKYRNSHPEVSRNYYIRNKEKINLYSQKYVREHTEHKLELNRRYAMKIRTQVLEHYGNRCACCGETENHFLSIDHINGGGTEHRKTIGSRNIYRWLWKNNYPDGFQLLCYNCNLAKGFYGICPHQEKLVLDKKEMMVYTKDNKAVEEPVTETVMETERIENDTEKLEN